MVRHKLVDVLFFAFAGLISYLHVDMKVIL